MKSLYQPTKQQCVPILGINRNGRSALINCRVRGRELGGGISAPTGQSELMVDAGQAMVVRSRVSQVVE